MFHDSTTQWNIQVFHLSQNRYTIAMKFNIDISTLTVCPVPPSTDTYTAVPHIDIHNKVVEVLGKKGIDINYTQFKSNKKGTQVITTYHLDVGNGEFEGMLAWRNSYDKTRSVAIVSGSSCSICENGCVIGEMKFLHKHTGTVDEMLEQAIEEQVGKIQTCVDETVQLKKDLQFLTFDRNKAGQAIGVLYLDNVLTTTQLEIIKAELQESSYQYGTSEDSMWTLFNHVTHALKLSHPSKYFEDHLKVVAYFK